MSAERQLVPFNRREVGLPTVASNSSDEENFHASREIPKVYFQSAGRGAEMPKRATTQSAGFDFILWHALDIYPMQIMEIKTGWKVELPQGTAGIIFPRSSYAARNLTVMGGLIDPDYRGEIDIKLWNLGQTVIHADRGDRITQMVVVPIVQCVPVLAGRLDETARGQGGFGSTGR